MGAALYRDFLLYYGIDLTDAMYGGEESQCSPRLLLALVEGLPEDSRFVAMSRGGDEYMGWDLQTRIVADLYDALRENTLALGHWKKNKAPNIPRYPRPWVKGEASASSDGTGKKKTTVHDIFAKMGIGVGKR